MDSLSSLLDRYNTTESQQTLDLVLQQLHRYHVDPGTLTTTDASVGTGIYSNVYRATWSMSWTDSYGHQKTLHRDVAVKELLPKQHKPFRFALRFARELQLWSTLDHPHILPFWGFHMDLSQNEAYFVSPYLLGGSVRSRLDLALVPMELRKRWVQDFTAGLLYLHSLDPPIVHGDLKAANVLVNQTNRAVLSGFGLCTILEDSGQTDLTTSDGFKGSIRWCSPELLQGERRTTTSDVWAWALVVLEIVTGRIPFSSLPSEAAVLVRLGTSPIPSRDEYPEVDSFLWDCLTKDRGCLRVETYSRPKMDICSRDISEWTSIGTSSVILNTSRDGCADVYTRLSPKGTMLVINTIVADHGVRSVVIRLDTGREIELPTVPCNTTFGEWSYETCISEDDQLCAILYDSPANELRIYDISGPEPTLLWTKQAYCMGFCGMQFAGDVLIAEWCGHDGPTCLDIICPRAKQQERIWYSDLQDPDAYGFRISVSPSCRLIATGSMEAKGISIYRKDAFLSALRHGGVIEPSLTPPRTLSTSFRLADIFWLNDDVVVCTENNQLVAYGIQQGSRRVLFAFDRSTDSYKWYSLANRGVIERWLVLRQEETKVGKKTAYVDHHFYMPDILSSDRPADWETSKFLPHFRTFGILRVCTFGGDQWVDPRKDEAALDTIVTTVDNNGHYITTAKRIHAPAVYSANAPPAPRPVHSGSGRSATSSR